MTKTIAVDFDGTCVEHKYPLVGQDAPDAVRVLRKLVENGNQLILWTMRDGLELSTAVEWFKDRHIDLWGIQRNPTQDQWTSSPKAYSQIYIDDAALGCPKIKPYLFTSEVVDWKAVEKEIFG
jgi:hypothetical protein